MWPWFDPDVLLPNGIGPLGSVDWLEATVVLTRKQQPTIEQRRKYISEKASALDLSSLIRDDEYDYVPIPDELVGNPGAPASAWIKATPRSVQTVMEVISACWREANEFGYVKGGKPTNMSDSDIEAVLVELNEELRDQFGGWGRYAGFVSPTRFDLDALSIESKRAILARIQRVVYDTGVKDKLVPRK